jgi:hypothetical protein
LQSFVIPSQHAFPNRVFLLTYLPRLIDVCEVIAVSSDSTSSKELRLSITVGAGGMIAESNGLLGSIMA